MLGEPFLIILTMLTMLPVVGDAEARITRDAIVAGSGCAVSMLTIHTDCATEELKYLSLEIGNLIQEVLNL